MAAIASILVEHENGQCQQTHSPRKPIFIPGFMGILKKIKTGKSSRQVAAISIIGGKLKI